MSIQALSYLHAFPIQLSDISELEPQINNPKKRLQIQKEAIKTLNAESERIRKELENRKIALQNEIAASTALVAREELLAEHSAVPNSMDYDYPPPQEFFKIIEKEVSVFNFVKDIETSKTTKKIAFAALSTVAYVFIIPAINTVCTQVIKNYLRQIPIVGLPLSISLKAIQLIVDLPRKICKTAIDPTPYDMHVCDDIGPLYNEDGTPVLAKTSVQELTVTALSVIAIPTALLAIGHLRHQMQEKHSLNHDWARSFFSSYFEWKITKLQTLEDKYSLPTQLQNDPILNQEKYKCAKSDKLLIIPMRTPSNQVFQYSEIEKHLLDNHTCPTTGQELSGDRLNFDEKTYRQMMARVHQLSLSMPGN